MRTLVQAMTGEIVRQLTPAVMRSILSKDAAEGEKSSTLIDVSAVHALPGRLRLRCGALKNDAVSARSLTNTLSIVQGIEFASADHRTGSILIRYDAKLLNAELLQAAVIRLLEHEELSEQPSDEQTGRSILRILQSAARALPPQMLILAAGLLAATIIGYRSPSRNA